MPSNTATVPDLITLFDSLPPPLGVPGEGTRFSAQPIPGYEQHRLGMGTQGEPSLLLVVNVSAGRARPAPLVLEHLTVQYDIECRIGRRDGATEEGHFTVICCTDGNRTLHTHFLRVVGALVASLGTAPSRLDVGRAVDQLIELFRALEKPPRKTLQGLWAELLVIARAHDPAVLIRAWHATPEDRYDFSMGEQRIEVKSVTGRVRCHYFSLDQLSPPASTNLLIASMLVERAGAGVSILELADVVRARAREDPSLLLHIDRVVALTLGEGWRHAEEERFDRELAEDSLAFFDPDSIPKLGPVMPAGVSEVRFKSDLTASLPMVPARLRAAGGLFRAALRR